MDPITDDTINAWRINYGLVEWCPEDAAKWWAEHLDGKAPAGAVAALGLLLQERDALKRDAERYRWLRTAGAWESEVGMDILSEDPANFDAAVDAYMKDSKRLLHHNT